MTITGKVIKGDGYGRKLGFPTANLDRREYNRRGLKLKFGVYGGTVQILNLKSYILYPSAVVIGPLDKKGLPKLEAHLIGFKGNLYGKKISLELNKYIRPFKKFKNEEELKIAIAQDVSKIVRLAL